MNILRKEKINTCNGWGFGGQTGTFTYYDNGIVYFEGRNHHRHTGTSRADQWYVIIKETQFEEPFEFNLGINGNFKGASCVKVFRNGTHYHATFRDIQSFEQFGDTYELIESIKLTK